MRWLAKIPADATYNLPIARTDFFATVAAAAGARLPTDRVMDGLNLIPFITGTNTRSPHDTLFWRSGSYKTLLDGEWKLQVSARPMKMWLFDLRTDPTERMNLASSQ